MTADELLAKVHKRLGLGVDIQTFSDGSVEIRWKRDYDGEWSDERFAAASGPNALSAALANVLVAEDAADAKEEL